MSEFYRAHSKLGSTKTAVRLPNDTLEQLDEIRRLFRFRFPEQKFPTLSACLEQALRRYLDEFGDNPAALREEVLLFKERYAKHEPR